MIVFMFCRRRRRCFSFCLSSFLPFIRTFVLLFISFRTLIFVADSVAASDFIIHFAHTHTITNEFPKYWLYKWACNCLWLTVFEPDLAAIRISFFLSVLFVSILLSSIANDAFSLNFCLIKHEQPVVVQHVKLNTLFNGLFLSHSLTQQTVCDCAAVWKCLPQFSMKLLPLQCYGCFACMSTSCAVTSV